VHACGFPVHGLASLPIRRCSPRARKDALKEKNMKNEDLLTYAELHQVVGLPVGTLYSMVKKEQIPHVRLGRRLVRFRRIEIELWLKSRAVAAKAVA
jgi:excisionase family DNA binding protein